MLLIHANKLNDKTKSKTDKMKIKNVRSKMDINHIR